ncbi:MAG: hypothetical protein ABR567_03390 [Myxococcales bacterium]|nr:hypothetical protein [Myxococcales bacterium]
MKQPAVRWTIASLLMLALFWLPVVNGVACGALAAWWSTDRAKTIQHSIWAAAVLVLPLWAANLYGEVWNPFAMVSGFWRTLLSLVALIGGAALVSTLRTTRTAI